MNFRRLNLLFEMKSMGASFYVPLFIFLLLFIYSFTGIGFELTRKLSLFIEFIVCPMASWWSVYLLNDYYEENISETLFTYPVSFFYHGLLRVLSFLFIFMILLTILLTIISFNHEDMVLKESIISYIPQCMVYASFGFLIMVTTKNIIVPILLIVGYIAAKFFTQGDSIFPLYNIMFFQFDSLLLKDIALKSGMNVSLSIILFLVGHYILSRKQKI